jgi:hypothetical protein
MYYEILLALHSIWRYKLKRIIAAVLVLLFLICFTSAVAGTAGTATDPLISLSYLNGTYLPAIINESKSDVNDSLSLIFNTAENRLEDAYERYLAQIGGYEGYTLTDKNTSLNLPSGSTTSLLAGGSFVLTSGSASMTVEKGSVVNVSTGSEVGSTATVTMNERYFCTENTTAVFTAASSSTCLVDGFYKTEGGTIEKPGIFIDVSSTSWYNAAVNFVYEKNLFTGTSAVTFSPNTSMTRGMFVTVLYRLAGSPSVYATSIYPDVASASMYYYNAVSWANYNSIITGYDDGKFHPDDSITREQMAVIMYRYASYAGYNTSDDGSAAFDAFPDKKSVSSYAVTAMQWATAKGLINGSDGYLLPGGTASRAQVAQIILNFGTKIAGM